MEIRESKETIDSLLYLKCPTVRGGGRRDHKGVCNQSSLVGIQTSLGDYNATH